MGRQETIAKIAGHDKASPPTSSKVFLGRPQHLKFFHANIVFPFQYIEKKGFIKNFADGLAGQLSSSLKKDINFSVISYNAIRLFTEKVSGIKEIAAVFGAHYFFAGDIQFQKNTARITIEMFRADTSEQVWSQMFERKISPENIFEIQDDIIKHVMDALQGVGLGPLEKTKTDGMMAVA